MGYINFQKSLISLFNKSTANYNLLHVLGDNKNTRDWLYVIRHALAIEFVFHVTKSNRLLKYQIVISD